MHGTGTCIDSARQGFHFTVMYLSISTTHQPPSDLGYLLHKHPARVHMADLSFGTAHLFYPEVTEERCTAVLLVDVDAVGLVRRRRGLSGTEGMLDQYVNDRPYAASSMLSVAIADVLGTALNGTCRQRPELAETPIPLEAHLPVLPCQGGAALLGRLFEPLRYAVEAKPNPLDPQIPQWGDSRYFAVTLRGTVRLQDLLAHLYVLIPVLDQEKHYWVGEDEVAKLLAKGGEWLGAHPERELIVNRYLKHRRYLIKEALSRLAEEEPAEATEDTAIAKAEPEEVMEVPIRLHEQRLDQVFDVLKESGAKRVLDLGCGGGKLLAKLVREPQFEEIVGVDVSTRALEIAAERLQLPTIGQALLARVRLLQGALTYRDRRLEKFDAAAVVEVVEHLEPSRLPAFEAALFGYARPKLIVITTPNREYNALFPGMGEGSLRHPDHRFEWARSEFEQWGQEVARRNRYQVTFRPIGPEDPERGAPSQMAVFTR